METENINQSSSTPESASSFREPKNSRMGRVFGGGIIVLVGLLLLARKVGADIPQWLISWPMILIVIGLYVGVRHSFRGPAWAVLLLIGSAFLAQHIDPSLDFGHYVWPVVIIVIGLFIIFRPQKIQRRGVRWENNDYQPAKHDQAKGSSEDFIDSVTIFGGVKKNIFSKTFRGGEIVTIFGGTELNLTHADVPHPIELDITQIFGGAKLIIPPHWRVRSEDLVSIFGGVDDKRPIMPDSTYDHDKVLILKGTNIFGGIDIKSF